MCPGKLKSILMNMHYIGNDTLLNKVKHHITSKRFIHTMGVCKLSVELSKHYGADSQKAWIASLLHDYEKTISRSESNELVKRYALDNKYIDNQNLAHSKLAAISAKEDFNITDSDILNAISYHTTGRAGMSLLEKIIFVADTCEEGRTYKEASKLRRQAFDDLDGVCVFILEYIKKSLESKGEKVDKDTLDALDFFKSKL